MRKKTHGFSQTHSGILEVLKYYRDSMSLHQWNLVDGQKSYNGATMVVIQYFLCIFKKAEEISMYKVKVQIL